MLNLQKILVGRRNEELPAEVAAFGDSARREGQGCRAW